MKRIFIGAVFWIATLAFVPPVQAGPFDISDDTYVTHSRPCG